MIPISMSDVTAAFASSFDGKTDLTFSLIDSNADCSLLCLGSAAALTKAGSVGSTLVSRSL